MARESLTDDEALSALLDGALSPDDAEQLRARLAHDAALARRFEALRNADAAVREAYRGIVEAPLPQQVRDSIEAVASTDSTASPAHTTPTPFRAWASPWASLPAALALAAGFVIALVIGPLIGPLNSNLLETGGTIAPRSGLYNALERSASGESVEIEPGIVATPVLTFATTDGTLCRRLEIASSASMTQALACRRDAAWFVELADFASGTPGGPNGVYRPATGAQSPEIEDAIDRMIEGEPLGRDAENALIARGWTNVAQ
jgi:hypothetical protein